MKRSILLAFVMLLPVLAFGCKPKAGKKCAAGGDDCKSESVGLLCVDGAIVEVPCKGVGGCGNGSIMGILNTGGPITCAHDKSDVGDACEKDDMAACSADNKKMLRCTKGKWVEEMDCSGAKGCIYNVDGVSCTGGVSKEGDKCQQENAGACSPDKKSLLICQDGVFVIGSTCRGQNGCQLAGDSIKCDTSLAKDGDACDEGEDDGKAACATDKKSKLVCKGGKFTKVSDCSKCTAAFDKVECEP